MGCGRRVCSAGFKRHLQRLGDEFWAQVRGELPADDQADEVWAKLLWAGLNLEPGDLPGNTADTYLPKRASAFRGGTRPPFELTVAFVDEHRDEFGVEFICRQLQVAPSSYYAAKHRQVAPSARAVRGAVMMQVLLALWVANRKVYGAHELWKAARRAGHDIGRDQVAQLLRQLGTRACPGCARRCSPRNAIRTRPGHSAASAQGRHRNSCSRYSPARRY